MDEGMLSKVVVGNGATTSTTVRRPKWVSRNKYLSGTRDWRPSSGLPKADDTRANETKKKVSYSCDLCGKNYRSNYNLKVHMRVHTGGKPFHCQECEKSFGTSFLLERHMFCHNNESKNVCEFCNKCFPTKDSLKIHLRSHTGQQPYSCDKCDKRYPSQSSLNRHIHTHDDKPDHLCDECGKQFSSSGTLRVHMQCHVRERKFPCTRCRLRFKRQMDLQRHLKTHIDQPRSPCPFADCKHKFRRKDNMLRHLRLTHNQSNQEAFDSYNSLTEPSVSRTQAKSVLPSNVAPKVTNGSVPCYPSSTSVNVPADPVLPTSKLPADLVQEETRNEECAQSDSWNQNDQSAQQFSPLLNITPRTNQRSVIRSVESLDARRSYTEQPVPAVLQTVQNSAFFQTGRSADQDEHEYERERRDFDQRTYFSNIPCSPDVISVDIDPVPDPIVSPPEVHTVNKEVINHSHFTEFRYGTLFPFKPHIQPERFDYQQMVRQEYNVSQAPRGDVLDQPGLEENTSTLLDLSASSYAYCQSSNNITGIPSVDFTSSPYPQEDLSLLSHLGARRPQNFSVIRRASPVSVGFNERLQLDQDESRNFYNPISDPTTSGLTASSVSELDSSPFDLIQVQTNSSEKPIEASETRQSLHVNQHAIRDPRKNFLWENFNRQYKPN